MPHNSRPPVKRQQAAARLARLRAAGVQGLLTQHQAWHLSGGIVGSSDPQADGPLVSLSHIALRVPDCEAFIPDYLATRAA